MCEGHAPAARPQRTSRCSGGAAHNRMCICTHLCGSAARSGCVCNGNGNFRFTRTGLSVTIDTLWCPGGRRKARREFPSSKARPASRAFDFSRLLTARRLFCRIPLTGHSPLGISFPTLLAFLAAVVRGATAPTLTKVMGFGHATALAQDDQGQGGADLGSRRKRASKPLDGGRRVTPGARTPQ